MDWCVDHVTEYDDDEEEEEDGDSGDITDDDTLMGTSVDPEQPMMTDLRNTVTRSLSSVRQDIFDEVGQSKHR